jgi:hypothetical protein
MGFRRNLLFDAGTTVEENRLLSTSGFIEGDQPAVLQSPFKFRLGSDFSRAMETRPDTYTQAVSILTDLFRLASLKIAGIPAVAQATALPELLAPFLVALFTGAGTQLGSVGTFVGRLNGNGPDRRNISSGPGSR